MRSRTLPPLVAIAAAVIAGALARAAPAGADDGPVVEPPKIELHEDLVKRKKAVRWEPLIVPVVGGSSDIGALFGVSGTLAKLAPGCEPYCWKGSVIAALSIKSKPGGVQVPVQYYSVGFDIPGLAGGNLRLYPKLLFRRIVNANYYGMGNLLPADPGTSNVPGAEAFRRNQYQLMQAWARLHAQIRILGDLHLWLRLAGGYLMPEPYAGSVLEEDTARSGVDGYPEIHGTDPYPSVEMGAGLVWDTRDHEANPTRGAWVLFSVGGSPGRVFGLPHDYGQVVVDARVFVPLAGEYLVLAARAKTALHFGHVPFNDFDMDILRGIPSRRYRGMVLVTGSFELRSIFWRFSVLRQDFGLGALVFLDAGRVWAGWKPNETVDGTGNGIHFGLGGGIRIQWGETRVLRFDLAWSPAPGAISPVAFYFRIGHAF